MIQINECLPHTHAHNLNAHGTGAGEAWNRGYNNTIRWDKHHGQRNSPVIGSHGQNYQKSTVC